MEPSKSTENFRTTFKPVSSVSNLSDLFDLNDIFTEDYFPPELDFPGLQFNEDASVATYGSDGNSLKMPDQSQNFARPYTVAPQQRQGVIMIPPSVPRIQLTVPRKYSAIDQKARIKAEPEKSKITKETESKTNTLPTRTERSTTDRTRDLASDSSDPMNMTESQKIERRERNREHAKKSRIRKRVLLDSLQDQLTILRAENVKLRRIVVDRIPSHAGQILQDCTTEESNLLQGTDDDKLIKFGNSSNQYKPSRLTSNIAQDVLNSSNSMPPTSSSGANSSQPKQSAKILMEPDFRLIQSLITSQQNFVLSDPSLPDNPIVYASDGFCKLSGYKRQDVVGRNCRFLQGPGTDQAAVDIIRQGISEGRDISVCLLNYKADGEPFWNQFFLGALKDAEGQIVNYVGVQCPVNTIPVMEIKDRVKKLPMPPDM